MPLPADDTAGALACEAYSRGAQALATAFHHARDEGFGFSELQEKILISALASAMDGCEESFRSSLHMARMLGQRG